MPSEILATPTREEVENVIAMEGVYGAPERYLLALLSAVERLQGERDAQ